MADVSPLSIEEAYRRGQAIYELRLSNWGNVGAGQDANSYRSPIFVRPVLGVAISPDSDVPACIVQRSLGPLATSSIFVAGSVGQEDLVLNKGTPLLFPQAAPIRINALGQDLFGDTYTDSVGASQPFGTTQPLTVFGAPELKVLFLLSGSALLASPRNAFNVQATHTFAGGGEELVYAVPILGRRAVRVTARTAAGTTVTLRTTIIVGRWFRPPGFGPVIDNTKEAQLSTTAIGAATTATVLATDPEAPWLLIKATRTVGGGTLTWTARASD